MSLYLPICLLFTPFFFLQYQQQITVWNVVSYSLTSSQLSNLSIVNPSKHRFGFPFLSYRDHDYFNDMYKQTYIYNTVESYTSGHQNYYPLSALYRCLSVLDRFYCSLYKKYLISSTSFFDTINEKEIKLIWSSWSF